MLLKRTNLTKLPLYDTQDAGLYYVFRGQWQLSMMCTHAGKMPRSNVEEAAK